MTAPPASADVELPAVPELDRVRELTVGECVALAARIREFLIHTVTRTGGHLGANLGTVELTIALHRAFRSPDTPILFDTGHQAYTHKILTGRTAGIATLRSRHGLSGFPSRAESPHDFLENSHASVGPAWAYGMVAATRRSAVVVLGDGALTGGVAYEGLNAIGYRRAPVIVVVNDNGRSYAPTASRLTLGEPAEGRTNARPRLVALADALGLTYRGPVDGHDIGALDAMFAAAAAGPLPCLVHVRTQKGQGWEPAMTDAGKRLHDVGPATPDGDRAQPLWSETAGPALCELAAADPRVHVITAAMPDSLGLEAFRDRFPDRFHDVGIAEQAAVAVAAGLASQGARPFFAVVSSFLTRALDQVLNDVALHRLPVVFLLDRAGVTGPDGPSHHGLYDVGLLRNVPGVTIHAPATAAELGELLTDSLRREHGPMVVRYPKSVAAPGSGPPPPPSGLLRSGYDAGLVAHGDSLSLALAAADVLWREHGLDCAVWRPERIHPPDEPTVRFAATLPAVLTVDEVADTGGSAALLAGALARGGGRIPRIEAHTLPRGFVPHGTRAELLAEFGFSPRAVAAHLLALLGRPSARAGRGTRDRDESETA